MFLFKKILSQFFMPLSLCFIICTAGLILLWFTKRQRSAKVVITIGVVFLYLLSIEFFSDCLVVPFEGMYEPAAIQVRDVADCRIDGKGFGFVVVLGGGHVSDPDLPVTSQAGAETLIRLVEGIRMHRRCPGSKLVLSGGAVFDTIPNAEIMAVIACDLGIDRQDIIIEKESRDTKDEAVIIKDIVKDEPFLLVTSAYHMPRSMALFYKLGMNPVAVPTGHTVKSGKGIHPGLYHPGAESLSKADRAFHEALGMVWAKIRHQI